MIKIRKSSKCVKILNRLIYEEHGLIGQIFYSNSCGNFIVLYKTGLTTKDRHSIFRIRFIQSKEEYDVSKNKILSGEIKDFMFRSICNIGYLGKEYSNIRQTDPELCRILKARWKSIISRVYNKNDANYPNYGAKGVTVSENWHNFSEFYNDIISLENFNRKDFINGNVDIDKDKHSLYSDNAKKIYSKDTISIITHSNNMRYVDYESSANLQSHYFIYIDKNGNEFLGKNISSFAKCNNIHKQNICKILNNNLTNKTAGGYKYRKLTYDELAKAENGEIFTGDIIN